MQVWLRREKGGKEEEEVEQGGRGEGGSRTSLLVTAEKLDSQGDALVPLPRQDANISAVERRLKDVLFVNVVVTVAWEDLDREQQQIKTNTDHSC